MSRRKPIVAVVGSSLLAPVAWVTLLVVLVGCQTRDESFRGHKPAKLKHDQERDLSQLELTEAAVKRLAIETTAVTRQVVPRRRLLGGEVIASPGGSATLTAPMAGTVQAPTRGAGLPRPGSPLKAGQPVLRFAPMVAPGQNLHVELKRDLTNAQTRFDAAKRFADRLEVLGKEGAGDQNAYEMAAADMQVAQAELAAAKQRLSRLSGNNPLAADVTLPIRAPFSSVLMRLVVAEGQTVIAGAPLFEAAALSRLWVRVPIYVGDLSDVDRARAARVFPLGRGRDAAGGVLAQVVDAPAAGRPEIASADLYFELPAEASALVPGQRVRVEVPLKGDGEVHSVIPQAAVLYDVHGGAWAYVDRGGRTYERTRIEVSYVDEGLAVLSVAPPEGTKVVTAGAAELFGTEFGAQK